MPTYLERYQRGEHVQVWKELVAVGDAVRREPFLADATSVAQETMRRARHNVELLAGRLKQLGYHFCEPQAAWLPPSDDSLRALRAFERKIGSVPLSVRAWIEVVGSVNFMGSYPHLSYYAPQTNPSFVVGSPSGQAQQIDFSQLLQSANLSALFGGKKPPQGEQDNFQSSMATLQGALQKLMNMGVTPNKESAMPDLSPEEQAISDPLFVDMSELSLDAYGEWLDGDGEGAFPLIIAPDIHHKANISGGDGPEIHLPQAGADALLLNSEWGTQTFVEYLRLSFAWGGFPGLQDNARRDEGLLAALKEGLLPL